MMERGEVPAIDFAGVVQALVANALREAREGHATSVEVELSEDAVRVDDDGRGLPVQAHPQSGRSLVEVILTGPRRGPITTLARVNAHSLWLEVEVHAEGACWVQRYDLAVAAGPPARRGPSQRRGTRIACAPLLGAAPAFDALCELVRAASREAGPGPEVRVRLRDARAARDETIVVA